ncbi:hypothetical protein DFP73DRAFT_594577 [Morchella snyderi]|nr:hypothetical protein DFP73DRAFT_594577 [Morchella snyderi]
MNSQNDGSRDRWSYGEDGRRPTSYTSSNNQADKTRSQSQLTLKFEGESSEKRYNESPRAFYGDRNSTSSNDGTNDYFEDQCSNVGQYSNKSIRSSYGPVRKPSWSPTNYRLDLCYGASGGSRTSSSLASCSNWVYNTSLSGLSHTEQRPPSINDSYSVEENTLKENKHSVPVDLGKAENGQTSPVLCYRGGTSSTDLTSGKFEPRRRSNNSAHLHSSVVELVIESERHPGPILVPDSDKSIRSSTSDKRLGKRNSMHRTALSRSHNKKIEQQDEQEQQHEAEKINAKRRNSLSSDFEVVPTEEEVRRAREIWSETQKRNPSSGREDHLIQWARNILRAQANWEKLGYNNPHTRSVEQLQLRSGGSIEPIPIFYPDIDATRYYLPSTPHNMSPRMSLLSLQSLPTPVEEEPEGDSQDGQLDQTYSPLYNSSRLPGSLLRSTTQAPVVRSDQTSTHQDEPAPKSADKEEVDGKINKKNIFTGRAISSKNFLPGYKNINKRCMRALKNITGKTLRVPVPNLLRSVPSYPAPVPTSPPIPPSTRSQSVGTSTVEVYSALDPNDNVLEGPPSFGVIRNFPANEESLRQAENDIAASIGFMTSPLVEIQVQLRQDLFARGLA